jgi:hypothetical protein
MKNLPDQSEVLTENAQLGLQASNLRAQLAAQGKPVAALEMSADIIQANGALKSHVEALQAALAGKVTPANPSATTKPQTLTERCVAAKAALKISALDALD